MSLNANDGPADGAPDHVRHLRRLPAVSGRVGLPDSRDPILRLDALRRRRGAVAEKVPDGLEVEREREEEDLPLCAAGNF